MHFHLPRRHRRKLLFPPGLLALAGLLWLGCVVVGSWREKLSPRYALRLTMPLRPPHSSQFLRFFEVPNPDTVCKSCTWHDASFTGSPVNDKHEQTAIVGYVRDIVADTMHAGGVRIRFTSMAHYSSLIFALNLMNEYSVKKWWLDITRRPTTFYVITDAYKIRAENPKSNFEIAPSPVLVNDVIYHQAQTPNKKHSNSWLAFWQLKWLQPLQQPEWQASMWLLAAIATLSSWRIVRAWRTT
jgi:hypothetical protein